MEGAFNNVSFRKGRPGLTLKAVGLFFFKAEEIFLQNQDPPCP